MTNISFVLTFALTALIIYRNNLVKMIIGQELLSVGLNIFLISAGITISDANILSATLFLWIIGAVDVAVGLPLVMAMTSSAYKPVIPLDYVIALSAGARKLTDFISDRLFVQMTVKIAGLNQLGYGLG